MTGVIDARLEELGITIPDAPIPAANYVPWVVTGNTVFIAGQVPFRNGELSHIGKLGDKFSVEDGQACARIVAINILAQLKAACGGDLDRVSRCVKLGGFVNCTPDFADHPKVVNGASNLIVEIFGDKGKHARFAVGAPSLPFNVAVEIDAIFEIE
ncbi:MAG: RidA family protein [Rhodospirillaceae bacterium]|nr:RidA family protein [Rhodospirillaceae bacterium]